MINKFCFTFAFIILFCSLTFAQIEYSAGINAGGGFISANSPNEGAFTSSIFLDAYLNPEDYLSTRIGFIYATDFNSLVPGSRKQHYPSVKGLYIKGVYSYYITHDLFMEQSLGLLTLNDKIYSDRNTWDFGIVVSLTAGIDFREEYENGFRLGIGLEYGTTFIRYTIQYYTTFFQLQYIF